MASSEEDVKVQIRLLARHDLDTIQGWDVDPEDRSTCLVNHPGNDLDDTWRDWSEHPEQRRAYAITVGSELVGHVTLPNIRRSPPPAEAYIDFFVRKEARRKGYGLQAVRKVLDEARGMGLSKILAVRATQAGKKLLEQIGFRACGGFLASYDLRDDPG